MNIGEIISALVLCASSFDDDKDHLLMLRGVYEIEVGDEYIEVHFIDRNTASIRIFRDGRKEYL